MAFSTHGISQITSYPHSSNFTSSFGDWNQSSTDDFNWTQTTSGTPSGGTGPQGSVGANGTTGYIFTESSSATGVSSGDIARLWLNYDLRTKTTANIDFYYYMYANNGSSYGPGTLSIVVYTSDDYVTWSAGTVLWSNSTSNNSWQTASISLNSQCGKYVQVQIKSEITSWQSDNSVDEFVVSATEPTSVTWTNGGNDNNWSTASNWSSNSSPTSSSNCIIPAGVPCDISVGGSCNDITVESGALLNILGGTITVSGNLVSSTGQLIITDGKLDISGTADLGTTTIGTNGEIEIDGAAELASGSVLGIDGLFDANGNFDATVDPPTFPNADINFGGVGRLTLAGSTNYLGDLSTTDGTVEYDGTTQTIVSDTYFNLEIDGSGTKTAGGNLVTIGSVNITAGVMAMSSYDLTIGDDFNCTQYGFDEGTGDITFNSSNSHDITHNGSSETTLTLTDHFDENWDNGSATNTWTTNNASGNGWYVDPSGFAYYYYDASSPALSIHWTSVQSFNAGDVLDFTWKDATGGYTEKYALVISTSTNYWGTTTIYDETGFSTTSWTSRSASYTIPSTNNYYIGFLCYSDADMFWCGIDDFDINKTTSVSQDCAGKLNNFTINGTGDLTLNSPLTIDGTLVLTNGNIISTSTNYVKVTKNGSISGGDSDSHIIGELRLETNSTSEKNFPVGDGTNYRPVLLTPSSSSDETWVVKYYNTAHASTTMGSGLDHVSQYYWDISRTNNVDAQLAFDWDASYAVDVPIDLRLAHYNSTNSEWEDMNATCSGSGGNGQASANSGRLTATATSFSPFGFGSSSSGNALPIVLLSWDGWMVEGVDPYVHLEWSVASQQNNDYYTIERSQDGFEWTKIDEVQGAGNTNTQMDYTAYDRNPVDGWNYYRLSQTDYDGTTEYFEVIPVQYNRPIQLSINPNPVKENLILYLSEELKGNTKISIYDSRGVEVYNKNFIGEWKVIELNASKLKKGYYVLDVDHRTRKGTLKFIKE